ncbi:hypothetical protein [Candidatus Kuenenia stuttgartiensis]|uniref:hypothetical protein n=1 Tax=Kuenenia stuttgartiensis TaxID=174633 RepID=UPI00146DF76E|nr:hypothetical protein [Candidatus Kuenenia stuttgartiensis]
MKKVLGRFNLSYSKQKSGCDKLKSFDRTTGTTLIKKFKMVWQKSVRTNDQIIT